MSNVPRFVNRTNVRVGIYDDTGKKVLIFPWSMRNHRKDVLLMVEGEHWTKHTGPGRPLSRFLDTDTADVAEVQVLRTAGSAEAVESAPVVLASSGAGVGVRALTGRFIGSGDVIRDGKVVYDGDSPGSSAAASEVEPAGTSEAEVVSVPAPKEATARTVTPRKPAPVKKKTTKKTTKKATKRAAVPHLPKRRNSRA